MKKAAAIGMSVVMLLGAMAGCSPSGSSPGESENKTVKLGYVNWSEGIAMTNLAAAVLEDEMGYKVELTMADIAPVFTSVASGNTDAFMDVWLPITHEDYMKEYGDRMDDLGVCYENAMIGLTVPSYVPVNSIEELNANKELFGGEIIGIDSGSATMKATYKLIDDYALDYKLLPGSGPTMTAALKKAIDANKPIVVVGWKPHWKFARWDLKVLEDPKKIYGTSENIHIVSRKGLSEDMPEVVDFLKNFKMNEQEIGDLMGAIEEKGGDPLDVAREWAKEHQNLIKGWIPAK
ncbi:ABC transporter, quaternary amine uptake transporter family, substrate-binding protein [Clostridium sp. MSTE9]|uniref:glycine betaine ABC transporter substrate-binding protein n=1 Tax=Clostridium sp. (strain MSTE9) TaxID=1105031 RepID=UPI00026F1B5F|nr:glycine betaine ABC transporter substrate-binding protein [Clostridium sp. MSTE9]EJF38438.1 ABC transporter, quaternary amine uptake transporter family, substrate-binding protein [Clostridium sp. MSTE9]